MNKYIKKEVLETPLCLCASFSAFILVKIWKLDKQ